MENTGAFKTYHKPQIVKYIKEYNNRDNKTRV